MDSGLSNRNSYLTDYFKHQIQTVKMFLKKLYFNKLTKSFT